MSTPTRDRSTSSSGRTAGASLVEWREPGRNARMLDWHERAHTFGLVPVERSGPVEQVVETPERLLSEGEPEAFDKQPLDEAEREAMKPEEIEKAPEARARRVPPALIEQLDRDGRLVQPIGHGGNEMVVAFRKQDSTLVEERMLTAAYLSRSLAERGVSDHGTGVSNGDQGHSEAKPQPNAALCPGPCIF